MAMPSGRRSSDPMPDPYGQRDSAQQRGHGGHHDGAKAQQAGLVDRIGRVQAALPFSFQREVDHHDAVLFHNADQQDDADNRHHAQILVKQDEGEQRAHSGRRQGGKDGDGVNEALVEHTEHDVHRDQGSQNQQGFIGEGVLKSGGGSLEAGLHAGGEVHLLRRFIDSLDGLTQRSVGGQVERNRH